MLKNAADKSTVVKRIAVITRCDALTEMLERLLRSWKFQIGDVGDKNILLLAEEGSVVPEAGRQVLWMVSSGPRHPDRQPFPLRIESFWRFLETRYHQPPRVHIRMDVEVPAVLTFRGETSDVTLTGLSDMGCRFSTPLEPVRDEEASLALTLDDESFRIRCRVIYAFPEPAAAIPEMKVGLIFTRMDTATKERVRSHIVLWYLEKVRAEMDAARFRKALEYFALPALVAARLNP